MSDDAGDRPKVVQLTMSLKDAALRYAAKGKPVFPCKPIVKSPYTPNGWKDATTDPAIIEGWWTDHPDAWIGMPTGEVSGFVIVDLDLKPGIDGRESWGDLQSRHGMAPETVEILTPSGGTHLWYRWPGVPIKTNSSQLGPCIDIRGDGGYVICPPSPGYEQEASSVNSFAPMPEWLVALAKKTPREVSRFGQTSGGSGSFQSQIGSFQSQIETSNPQQPVMVGQLIDQIIKGDPLHDSIRSLAAHMRATGMTEPAAVAYIQGLMRVSQARTDRPEVWEERYRDIGRQVRTAEQFAPEALPPAAGMQAISAEALLAMQFPELHWTVEALIPEGTSLLFGKPKKGKSFLSMLLAISVAAGRPAFGRRTSGATVLYLGLEDSERRLKRRLGQCARTLEVQPHVLAHKLHLSTTAQRIDTGLTDELHAWMKGHPTTGLIVIDMLKKVQGEQKGKDLYREQALVGEALSALCHQYPGLSVIVVHHSRKQESDDPFDLISGTTGLSGSYDNLIAISDNGQERTLHFTGRDIEAVDVPLLMSDGGMYTLEDPETDAAISRRMSDTRRVVYDAVPSGVAYERKDIVSACVNQGLSENDVAQQLRLLIKQQLIEKSGYGMYQKTSRKWFDGRQ